MNYLFSSDFHFFHKNILIYENRPFESIIQMNSEIIRRHNERVKEDDIFFFLGDVGFYASKDRAFRGEGMPVPCLQLFNELKGIKYRVCGNHDTRSNKTHVPLKSITLEISQLKVQLIHDPAEADIENHQLIIHGHQHSKTKNTEKLNSQNIFVLFINVSCENTNYYPITWDEIKAIWDTWLKSKNFLEKKAINTWIYQQGNK
jgi:calcineurin-like phosphoesterase family protein